jgi:ABC-type multidrug transport system fused ATPase/permease subunit
MKWTDARIRLLSELLNGMKIVKLMAWELPFLERLAAIRIKEISLVRSLLITRAGNMAVAMSLPILGELGRATRTSQRGDLTLYDGLPAAILSFITYAHTVSSLDAATLFTVITLFQLIRLPLMLFPMTLSAATDAMQAIGRLERVFMAETRTDKIEIDFDLDVGIKVENASWTWDSAPALEEDLSKKDAKAIMGKGGAGPQPRSAKMTKPWRWIKNKRTGKIEVATEQHAEIAAGDSGLQEASDPSTTTQPGAVVSEKENVVQQDIFQLHDINLQIPRGALVAIVGAIGSGKSSLLSGLVNEMRRTSGKVIFGGTTSMVPQTPWIVAATLRENILFGLPFDEDKYWWAVREACLEPDLEMLEDGDATAIGEKGINLSVSKGRVLHYHTLYTTLTSVCP